MSTEKSIFFVIFAKPKISSIFLAGPGRAESEII